MIARTLLCVGLLLAAGSDKPEAPTQDRPAAEQPANPQSTPEAKPEAAEADEELKLLAIEENIIKYTNAQRAKYGLAALKVDRELMESARQHASWMARNQKLVHTRRQVAENIAKGQPHSLSAVGDWMRSSGHRANILNRSYHLIGAAAYRTPEGTIYWCQQFKR
jgi:uncharacterized protein YkwD